MKTIGLLGGMSWESTAGYYRAINQGIKKQLGGLHSAEIIMYSVDFAPIEALQHSGNWQQTGEILSKAACAMEAGGADFFLICTNTMHKVAKQVEAAVTIPLLHIADATGNALLSKGIKKVGLLGTAFTMEQDFYRGRLEKKFGLEVIIPEKENRQTVHDIIYQELCQGRIIPQSQAKYIDIVDNLAHKGAEAVILGCTEIGMLIKESDVTLPLFDTTLIHAAAAVKKALAES
ncbi:MAG: aspartate racemase [Desulfobulbus sp.]|nr:MAG: aspartate racemase [Desulfobulbus sp.]